MFDFRYFDEGTISSNDAGSPNLIRLFRVQLRKMGFIFFTQELVNFINLFLEKAVLRNKHGVKSSIFNVFGTFFQVGGVGQFHNKVAGILIVSGLTHGVIDMSRCSFSPFVFITTISVKISTGRPWVPCFSNFCPILIIMIEAPFLSIFNLGSCIGTFIDTYVRAWCFMFVISF